MEVEVWNGEGCEALGRKSTVPHPVNYLLQWKKTYVGALLIYKLYISLDMRS